MDIRSLKEAGEFAKIYGCKAIVYGSPGSGKTPVIGSCPRPVLLATESGMLSMKGSKVPTWQAFTPEAIDEFFKWFFHSNESRNFDTLAIDSAAQMADIYLQASLKKNKHGLKAYGEMAENVMNHLRPLYYLQNKHAYVICKETNVESKYRPYFPGNQLNVEVPHLYDFILHLGIKNIPGEGQHKAFQCNESFDVMSRNRTGNLADFEPPDFGLLVRKAMS